jgi:hypothetical protein
MPGSGGTIAESSRKTNFEDTRMLGSKEDERKQSPPWEVEGLLKITELELYAAGKKNGDDHHVSQHKGRPFGLPNHIFVISE